MFIFIVTKKSYISKLENGHADVQLSTLFRIFAGLGKRVSVAILWHVQVLGWVFGVVLGWVFEQHPPLCFPFTQRPFDELGVVSAILKK